MSIFSVQARKHTAYYDHLVSVSTSRTLGDRDRQGDLKVADTTLGNSGPSGGESVAEESRLSDKSSQVNRTYVVSAPSKSGSGLPYRSRLTLQRRSKRKSGTEKSLTESSQNSTPAPEKRSTSQRRTRTPSTDKSMRGVNVTAGPQPTPKVLSEPNGRTTLFRTASLRETASKIKRTEAATHGAHAKTPSFASRHSNDSNQTFKTPTRRTPFEKIAAKRDVFERSACKDATKQVAAKPASSDRSKPKGQQAENAKPVPTPRVSKPSSGTHRAHGGVQERKPSTANQRGDVTFPRMSTPAPDEQTSSHPCEAAGQQDSFKMENSAVTVAVRVRPFSAREKAEKASQVIFMNGQETHVQHPDSRQSYSFTYDFSFCSVDGSEPTFASQKTVYESLARPLLQRAFEGFNTCLFAYGQTGSGKSYTMMGFEEEAGVIPRFCHELFCKSSSIEDEEVKCHVEMSYFEVYNEKIHDSSVTREEPNQRKMPSKVREHPVHGPYVAELSANVVSSYSDIQGWSEIGNKQRATAATGMNDKSSRSHSVFTSVMTQTKTEFVEGEEHDHSITSRINSVDLAGSERSSTAQTSGDRLREGASINKSSLTLGKVISASSEQMLTRKKVFIPYRESVLTWSSKESLGGNSKTAMIATVSPAGTNVEESSSTSRYAQQARTIINVAKVNEDTSAKSIRESKAEVEKSRAVQMSSQGVEPERVRMFQQEINSSKNKLCQQEREMVEANRAWREKLEQAEIRKREETKELQKAGVTFKVDNRLPISVNLNEDPQLSEMLLYMIKEGRTTVGKLKPDSSHDIQLTGTLIADRHCVISNIHNTVSIIPMDNAKTFVNGSLISESTVLHHGDRVILGGDHYFRFNHPAEVQSGKRASCWTGAGGDGQRDFEFAKNELLAAQRAKSEAEIEEAHFKAKEEMMQGIQMAKEVAQKELSDQKTLYEKRIQALERESNEENERKRQQEMAQQQVASQVAELKIAKSQLEKEVDSQKRRLRSHMEAQAMEEQRVCQAKIVEASEAEKRKISKESEEMQMKRALRENQTTRNASPQWDAMKSSSMIEEANKISVKSKKHTLFSRHESSESENAQQGGLQVRVQNTKSGISTFWSSDKFQNNMAAMRELEQGDSASKDDDVFYDPDDEWEQDISASSASTSSFSRRRSRSLLKTKRISGRSYEIRVHPIQSLTNSSQSSGSMCGAVRPPSNCTSATEPAVPSICKESIGRSSARSRSCSETEETLADRSMSDSNSVYTAVQTISDLYEGLDDDSQDSVFVCSVAAQTESVKATTALETAVFVTMQWLASVKSSSGSLYTVAEELKSQVKKMGGFFQMLIQGCESEITSMVKEARRKSSQCLDAAMIALAMSAVVTGTPLSVMVLSNQTTGKQSLLSCSQRGTRKGVQSLSEESLAITMAMLRDAQSAYPRNPVLQSLKSKTLDVSHASQSYIRCLISEQEIKVEDLQEEDEDAALLAHLQRSRTTSSKVFQSTQAIQQMHSCLSTASRDGNPDLSSCRESISSSTKAVDESVTGVSKKGAEASLSQLPCLQTVISARDELQLASRSLSSSFWSQQGVGDSRCSAGSDKSSENDSLTKERVSTHSTVRNKVVSKIVYIAPGASRSGSPHWV